MTLGSMSESMRSAFYRDLLERVATAPMPTPPARTRVFAILDEIETELDPIEARRAAMRSYSGRVCLSCGAHESGGVLPCGH
ncbi:hypothetical protein QZM62_12850 [Burkholderia multivorans]|nr:hypothetical protein [Burkholderia multivorans]